MLNRIIMDTVLGQIRIAITQGQRLNHFFLRREKHPSNHDDIYMGRVQQVKPGLQAAFIDIGKDKNGFLNFSDLAEEDNPKLLKNGQEIIVQIKKDPVGDKGARLTTKCTISGHYLVLLIKEDRIFISKKISDKGERDRLKIAVEGIKPAGYGVIIRTEANGIDMEIIQKELSHLLEKWNGINKFESAPKLLYKGASIVEKTLRDYYTKEVDEIAVNDMDIFYKLQEYFSPYFPNAMHKIKYVNKGNLLEYYEVENQVMKLYNRKVWLKSGGYIIIDYTEALTVIDINSGKYTGNSKNNVDETIFKINLEATEVIADQIRLRNISGIIIVDYINIKRTKDQEVILKHLHKCLQEDKVRTKVYGFTELFILQMTRKQEGKSIQSLNTQPCVLCGGTGAIPNQEALFYQCLSNIDKNKDLLEGEAIRVKVNPYLRHLMDEIELYNMQRTFIEMIKEYYSIKVIVEEDPFLDLNELKVLPYV